MPFNPVTPFRVSRTASGFADPSPVSMLYFPFNNALTGKDKYQAPFDPDHQSVFQAIDGGSGVEITINDDLRLYRGPGDHPSDLAEIGRVLDLDSANTEYASISDSVQKGLDPGYGDYGFFAVIRIDSFPTGAAWLPIFNKKDGGRISAYIKSSDNHLYSFLDDGTNSKIADLGLVQDPIGRLVSVFIYWDRDGYCYGYIDGFFNGKEDISTLTGSIDATWNFFVGATIYGNEYFDGFIGIVRVFNFGTNPDVDHAKLARRLHENPYASLSELGFGEWENANWNELLTNGDFESYTGTQDDGVSDTFDGWIVDTKGGGVVDATATSYSGSNAVKLIHGSSTGWDYHAGVRTFITVEPNRMYQLRYYTKDNGTRGIRVALMDWDNGTTFFEQDMTPVGSEYARQDLIFKTPVGCHTLRVFFLASYYAGTTVYLDYVSLHRVGEVANWDFHDDSSSTVFTDKTDNHNDLTPYSGGAATTAGTLQMNNPLIIPGKFASVNSRVGTISVWVRPNWDGDDGQAHTVLDFYAGALGGQIWLVKGTSNAWTFGIKDSMGNAHYASASSISVSAGSLVHLVARWDLLRGIQELWVDNTLAANVTFNKYAFIDGYGRSYLNCGADLNVANQFDGVITNLHIIDFWIPDTKAEARAQGLPEELSIEGLYNNGTPIDPPNNPHVLTEFFVE